MSKEYIHTKNYIHNELGINKEFIEKFTEKYLSKSIDTMISDKLSSGWIESLIIKKIGEIVTGEKHYSKFGSNKGVDYIKSVIKESVKEEVVKRINFDKIDVT